MHLAKSARADQGESRKLLVQEVCQRDIDRSHTLAPSQIESPLTSLKVFLRIPAANQFGIVEPVAASAFREETADLD